MNLVQDLKTELVSLVQVLKMVLVTQMVLKTEWVETVLKTELETIKVVKVLEKE
jgi:hypothetical protein